MPQQYQLHFYNNSSLPGDVCVFQNDPDIGVTDVQSLAWFAYPTNPGVGVTFSWEIDYSFVWSAAGPLIPGVTFDASQVVAADLKASNEITYTVANGAPEFTGQTSVTPSGSLVVLESSLVAANQSSVGIGMSGTGTYAISAQPNYTLTFSPHPVYFIAFGTFTPGLVLSETQMTSNAPEVTYATNVYQMYATLNPDNTWTISATPPSQNVVYVQYKRGK